MRRIRAGSAPSRNLVRYLLFCLALGSHASVSRGEAGSAAGISSALSRAIDASIDTPGTTHLDAVGEWGTGKARALALFHQGLKLETRGDNQSALAAYLEILAGGNYTSEVAERAATLVAAEGDRDRALKILESATLHLPDSPAPFLALCRYHVIFAEQGDDSIDRALTVARETAQQFPRSLEAMEQLIALLRSEGDLPAVRAFLQGPARSSALADRDVRRMLAIAQAAQKVWPTNRANTRAAHLERLDSFFEDVIELAAENHSALSEAAEYFALSGRLERAREIFAAITSSRPGLLDQRFRLADIRKALGDDDGHLADLESLVAIDPNNPNTHRSLSRIYRERDMPGKAVTHLQTSLDLAPGKLPDHLMLSRIYHAIGDYRQASRTSRRTLVLFPDSTEARYLGALAKTRLAAYEEAAEDFRSAEKMAENNSHISLDADFHFEFGVALERSGDLDQAAEKFRTALELVDDGDKHTSARIYNHFGYAWLENGLHIDQAGEMIKRANELAPDVSAYVDSLGWFHHVKGEHEAAERDFELAWKLLLAECQEAGLAPVEADAVILEHAARAQIALGKIPEALESLRKGLELAPGNRAMHDLLEQVKPATTSPSPAQPSPAANERPPLQANSPAGPLSSGAAR